MTHKLLTGSYRSVNDFIDPHDDKAYKGTVFSKVCLLIQMSIKNFTELRGEQYSRVIALVYYITPNDWTAKDGGSFIDYQRSDGDAPEPDVSESI